MTPTQKYLRLDDEILEIRNVMRRLTDNLRALEGQQNEVKEQMIAEYLNDGVLPDDGLIVKKIPPKLIVTDENKLPEKFFKIERKLNKAELNKEWKAGNLYAGTTIDNGGYTLAIKGK
jgi:hypothetical protein